MLPFLCLLKKVFKWIEDVDRAFHGLKEHLACLPSLGRTMQGEDLYLYLVVTTARRPKPYFQAHPIVVLTDQPLRAVLQRPGVSGRMVKWVVELGEFDICCQPRTTIKGQAFINFLVELTSPESDEGNPPGLSWTLHVDGSSTASANGAGLLLTTLEGVKIEYAIRLGFKVTNNEVEYKALIAGLNAAKEAKTNWTIVYTDSKLVEG